MAKMTRAELVELVETVAMEAANDAISLHERTAYHLSRNCIDGIVRKRVTKEIIKYDRGRDACDKEKGYKHKHDVDLMCAELGRTCLNQRAGKCLGKPYPTFCQHYSSSHGWKPGPAGKAFAAYDEELRRIGKMCRHAFMYNKPTEAELRACAMSSCHGRNCGTCIDYSRGRCYGRARPSQQPLPFAHNTVWSESEDRNVRKAVKCLLFDRAKFLGRTPSAIKERILRKGMLHAT